MAVIYVVFVLIALRTTSSAPNSKTVSADGGFVYPGPHKPVDPQRYTPVKTVTANESESCTTVGETTFCTGKPAEYPDDAIKELFKNKKKQVPGPELEIQPVDIGNRQGGPEETDNCASTVSYEPIYRFKSGDSWQNVVQAPEWDYQQKVRLEKCKNPDSSCFSVATFPIGINTMCRQKFATWKLQVMDENKKPVLKEVELPSCCSCHYTYA